MKMKELFLYLREGIGKNAERQMSRVTELCQRTSKESNKLEKEIGIYGITHGSPKMKQLGHMWHLIVKLKIFVF